jgi:hypothetical protein
MTAYTFLWSEKTWKARAKEVQAGKNLYIDYVAGEAKRPLTNFSDGDEIFVVTVMQGQLFLGGRLIVDSSPVSREKAEFRLGRSDLLDKELFVLAKDSLLDKFRSGKPVGSEAARSLDLITSEGVRKRPDLDRKNMIDRQAFRIPYKLSPESASVLRECLDLSADTGIEIKLGQSQDDPAPLSVSGKKSENLSESFKHGNQGIQGLNAGSPVNEKINELRLADLHTETNLESSLIAADYAGRPGEDINAIVKRRLGQGSFRRLLEEMHGVACCVSGLKNRNLLIASHIVPWSKSQPDQKTDPENGLLLSVSWDALFDKGFISFTENGQLLCASVLDADTISCLGVKMGVRLDKALMTEKRKRNLLWHRENVFDYFA